MRSSEPYHPCPSLHAEDVIGPPDLVLLPPTPPLLNGKVLPCVWPLARKVRKEQPVVIVKIRLDLGAEFTAAAETVLSVYLLFPFYRWGTEAPRL
jgi:hypothetical protein